MKTSRQAFVADDREWNRGHYFRSVSFLEQKENQISSVHVPFTKEDNVWFYVATTFVALRNCSLFDNGLFHLFPICRFMAIDARRRSKMAMALDHSIFF